MGSCADVGKGGVRGSACLSHLQGGWGVPAEKKRCLTGCCEVSHVFKERGGVALSRSNEYR